MLKTLVDADPSDDASRRLYAWTLSRLGRHEEAIAYFRALIQAVPADLDAPLNLAENLIAVGQPVEAIALLQRAAEREPRNAHVLQLLANAYVAGRELQNALVTYRRVITLPPKDAEAHTNLAAVLIELRHWDDAVAASRAALAIREHAATFYNLGYALTELCRWDDAAAAFRKAIELDPDAQDARLSLAIVFSKQRRHGDAIALLDALTSGRTVNGVALAMLAGVLTASGRTDESIEAARTPVSAEHDFPQAHRELGWALLRNRSFSEALASFRTSQISRRMTSVRRWAALALH
jgi:tetratricopeptide (TPR) repeat protein